jgi:hypothetical protein
MAGYYLGSMRGRGSVTRIYDYCVRYTGDHNSCRNQILFGTPPPIIQLKYIYSKNNTSRGIFDIGDNIDKDMRENIYNDSFSGDRLVELAALFVSSNIDPPSDDNVVQGDKSEENRYQSSYWADWSGDVFDSWGNFFFYNESSGNYYFPLINPINQPDGQLFSQTFNVFDKTFTMLQGFPVRGIFKFDITVNDPSYIFRFGCYGNFGSDSNSQSALLTYPYSKNGKSLTLYYFYNRELTKPTETIYVYFIPKLISQNNSQTFKVSNIIVVDDNQIGSIDHNSCISVPLSYGLIVYLSRGNDVKDWIINDLDIN